MCLSFIERPLDMSVWPGIRITSVITSGLKAWALASCCSLFSVVSQLVPQEPGVETTVLASWCLTLVILETVEHWRPGF